MRTRTSARNQDRLWRYLGGEPVKPPAPPVLTIDEQIAALEAQLLTEPRRFHYLTQRHLAALKARRAVAAYLQGQGEHP